MLKLLIFWWYLAWDLCASRFLKSCTSFFINILWYSFTNPFSLKNGMYADICHNQDATENFEGIVGIISIDWTR